MTSSLWLRLLFIQPPLDESHHSQFRLCLLHQPYPGLWATLLGRIWSTLWGRHYMSGPTETHPVACRLRLLWALLFLQSLGDKFLYASSPRLTQDRLLDLKRFSPTPLQLCLDFRLDHLPLVRLEVISGGSQRSRLSSGLPLHLRHLSTGASLLATLAPAASHRTLVKVILSFFFHFSALLCSSKDGVTIYHSSFRTKYLQFSLERFIH